MHIVIASNLLTTYATMQIRRETVMEGLEPCGHQMSLRDLNVPASRMPNSSPTVAVSLSQSKLVRLDCAELSLATHPERLFLVLFTVGDAMLVVAGKLAVLV